MRPGAGANAENLRVTNCINDWFGETRGHRNSEPTGYAAVWLCHADARQVSDSSYFRPGARPVTSWLCHADARQVSDLPARSLSLQGLRPSVIDLRFLRKLLRQVRDLPRIRVARPWP